MCKPSLEGSRQMSKSPNDNKKGDGVPLLFVLWTLVTSTTIAFAIGLSAKVYLVRSVKRASVNAEGLESPLNLKLPNPVLPVGKFLPPTVYASKHFDTARSVANSRWVVTEEGRRQCVDLPYNECHEVRPNLQEVNNSLLHDESEHLPQGQHLLIDIEHVKGDFLNSQVRLAHAMLDLVAECGLTLLSYHCHGLKPSGVSCAGVLLESHVSFHTWPVEGVITLDLYTCGDESLLPVVPVAKRLFGVANEGSDQKPHAIWAHKLRGFSGEDTSGDSAATDFYAFPIGEMIDMKEKVVSAQTDFQRVDIYDVLLPVTQSVDGYEKSLKNDGSYEADHPELFQPDRIVFLDGVMQSRRSGDAAYHEALVHPAMFAHSNPKRVAIIGGGEGATLREVLKHKTVEKVVMIEIDEQMVKLSREYLPDWSDCSMLEGSADSCFEDPRVELYCEDAFAWFIDRFSGNEEDRVEESFDVIIMDALDPQVDVDFVNALYDSGPFLGSIPKALGDNGIFLAQVGVSANMESPAEYLTLDKNRAKLVKTLVTLGFQSIRDYSEIHGGFDDPWQFAVAFKSFESQQDWFDSPATIDLKIRQRTVPTVDGKSPLLFFDGAAMATYTYPSKGIEYAFCRAYPNNAQCANGRGFDPERLGLPLSVLEVRPSSQGEHAGRGVFAKENIPRLSYIGLEELIHIIHIPSKSYDLMIKMEQHHANLFSDEETEGWWAEALEIYAHGYGHSFSRRGRLEVFVDPTLHTFINHGCAGSNNVGHNLTITEENANPKEIPPEILEDNLAGVVYNPAAARQSHFYSSASPLRDITKGEELLDNYFGMTGINIKGWSKDVEGLKQQCAGGAGSITEYERGYLYK